MVPQHLQLSHAITRHGCIIGKRHSQSTDLAGHMQTWQSHPIQPCSNMSTHRINISMIKVCNRQGMLLDGEPSVCTGQDHLLHICTILTAEICVWRVSRRCYIPVRNDREESGLFGKPRLLVSCYAVKCPVFSSRFVATKVPEDSQCVWLLEMPGVSHSASHGTLNCSNGPIHSCLRPLDTV